MKRPASLVTAIFLILLACAQLCRIILGASIVAAGIDIPLWPSVIAVIILVCLSVWLLIERRK